jgi:hypothetical protein
MSTFDVLRWITLAVVLVAPLFAGLGAYVATMKRRTPSEGIILGLLFGPFGVLVALLLPTEPAPAAAGAGAGSGHGHGDTTEPAEGAGARQRSFRVGS